MIDVIRQEIKNLISQKNYPCIAAVQAVAKNEIEIGTYGRLGSGTQWKKLRKDLEQFQKKQKQTGSRLLTFFAAFEPELAPDSEQVFEEKLWQELSFIAEKSDWPATATKNPTDIEFCFNLNQEKIFVVGLHPNASRKARIFSRPALIFNSFAQFDAFKQDGIYENLVESIRRRDLKFQGSINPMATKFGELWESIQFSGRNNTREWKCPFAFLHSKEKPV